MSNKYTLIQENGKHGVRYLDDLGQPSKFFFDSYWDADEFLSKKETEQRNQVIRYIMRMKEKEKK